MDASELPPSLAAAAAAAADQPPASNGELVVQNGRLIGARRALGSPMTLIGQVAGCDVRLNAEGVAPLHCAILADPAGPVLRDLDSQGGTRVNGQLVRSRRLAD